MCVPLWRDVRMIALALRTTEPVMALLTNMTDLWQFLWVGDASTVYVATLAHADDAFEVLRAALATDADDAVALPCLSDQPVQRRKLAGLVAAPHTTALGEIEWMLRTSATAPHAPLWSSVRTIKALLASGLERHTCMKGEKTVRFCCMLLDLSVKYDSLLKR